MGLHRQTKIYRQYTAFHRVPNTKTYGSLYFFLAVIAACVISAHLGIFMHYDVSTMLHGLWTALLLAGLDGSLSGGEAGDGHAEG
jgi:hypothetical protein